jgi:hypothetical protein
MLVLYVPAGHAVQAAMEVDAVLLLYVPAGHNVQTPALPTENEPAAQSVHAAAPATEYFPAAQAAHFDMPVLAANVPAAQFCASELHNQTSITCLLATASLVPCIGLQLWTQHHGCTSPQDTLRKRR